MPTNASRPVTGDDRRDAGSFYLLSWDSSNVSSDVPLSVPSLSIKRLPHAIISAATTITTTVQPTITAKLVSSVAAAALRVLLLAAPGLHLVTALHERRAEVERIRRTRGARAEAIAVAVALAAAATIEWVVTANVEREISHDKTLTHYSPTPKFSAIRLPKPLFDREVAEHGCQRLVLLDRCRILIDLREYVTRDRRIPAGHAQVAAHPGGHRAFQRRKTLDQCERR